MLKVVYRAGKFAYNTGEQKMVGHVTHYRISVCTRPTLIGAKHSDNTPTVASFTHRNAGIQ